MSDATTLSADPSRVVAELFLPGEGAATTRSRASEIVARVLAVPEEEAERLATRLIAEFGDRHPDIGSTFAAHAHMVGSLVRGRRPLTDARRTLLGATFTAEFAVEGAALCNPSAVPHPDQSGLQPGQLRVALALRQIGEGHLSSIGFAEAVVGPGRQWAFLPRERPLVTAEVVPGTWSRMHFRLALEYEQRLTDLTVAILGDLADPFTSSQIAAALVDMPGHLLLLHRESHIDAEAIRRMAGSAYGARFPPTSTLTQRVLMPVADEENHGMEDARFIRFTNENGAAEYRATYTAYDGRDIAPRLITSPDLQHFDIHRLVGDAARNKGMALFPRLVGGEHLALSRMDGETMGLASSSDGLLWNEAGTLPRPALGWELVQTGNCGSPIETDRGWLVLMHGVGPMRAYAIGALLLDLDDPTRVLARSTEPFLRPTGDLRDGYVPNVVYSCGAVVHDGMLWIPLGVGDSHVTVRSVPLEDLLDSLSPVGASVVR